MEDHGGADSPEGVEVTGLDPSRVTPTPLGNAWGPNRRLTFQQRLWRMISVVGLVLLMLAVILFGAPGFAQSLASRFGPQPQPPVRLVEPQDGLVSLAAAGWAPDSRRVAFIGYAQEQDFSYAPGVALVYDARSGQRLARFSPDAAIARALGVTLPAPDAPTPTPSAANPNGGELPYITYDTVVWSPDGRLLAIAFVVTTSWQDDGARDGLLLVTPDGTNPSILVLPHYRYYRYERPDAATEWDTRLGVAVAGPAYTDINASGGLPPIVAAPAWSYRWTPNGALVPAASSAPSPGDGGDFPLGAVGGPDGDGAFTIWQPGSVRYEDHSPYTQQGPFYDPGVYLWQTNIATWSPDGRFLIPSLSIGGRLVGQGVPQLSAAALADLQVDGLPPLPAHDAALLWRKYGASNWQVAWRPDGRALATYGAGGLYHLDVLDCASGRQLMSVQLPYGRDVSHSNGVLDGSNAPLLWSPDGSRLLLAVASAGTIVVYGPDQLPH